MLNSFFEFNETFSGFDGVLIDYQIDKGSKRNFGLHGRVSCEVLPSLYVNLTYTHILSPQEEFNEPNGRSRADLTVSYELISGE